MNSHGRRAMAYWQEHRPQAWEDLLATGTDTETFFTDLGEQIEETIANLTRQFAGPDLPGESYLEKVGRLNNARARAMEVAWAEQTEAFSPQVTRETWANEAAETLEDLLTWAEEVKEWQVYRAAGGEENQDLLSPSSPEPQETAEVSIRYLLPQVWLESLIEANLTTPDPPIEDLDQWRLAMREYREVNRTVMEVPDEVQPEATHQVVVWNPVREFLLRSGNWQEWQASVERRWQRDRNLTEAEISDRHPSRDIWIYHQQNQQLPPHMQVT
ncbi:hypothetical protein [Pseudactinotalea sp. Z1748]|uniref:hypothetical protein n=1 Tax=Pseudactinotalea sp. Z1748 TaxID=3413027 RepID=UPI003C7B8946